MILNKVVIKYKNNICKYNYIIQLCTHNETNLYTLAN